MKKAIKYTRFSSDGQSSFSIERQDTIIDNWVRYNSVHILDTFKDEGYTARTFDRPDIKQLFSFIKKYHSEIDYLLVAELTRFSRDTGDAINMVKKIQFEYNIKIVSCSRSTVYDCTDPNSFFMMGLEFLLGNSENIKRQNDINGGIYTAKAVKGKWIQGGPAPFGYKKEGVGQSRQLVIDESQAMVVRFIYDAYLRNTPDYIILKEVKKMGFPLKGNSVIKDILRNPLYSGQQFVKAFKELPGGLFAGKWRPIIDLLSWHKVQERLNYKPQTRHNSITDEMPLRGLLRCHCGRMLTGAPSRNRRGNYFFYYKCQDSAHNNISAIKAHQQLKEMLTDLSLPQRMIHAIREKSIITLEEKKKESQNLLYVKRKELEVCERQIKSMEEKWINEQINFETYNRWHSDLSQKRNLLQATINKLNRDKDETKQLLEANISKLSDLQAVFECSTTLQKQELLNHVFDNSLYYQDKVYRTPYITPVFAHNTQTLKEKHLLIVDDIMKNGPNGPVKWSRPESNRCPNMIFKSFLHAYFRIACRETTGTEQTNRFLSCMVLSNRHSLRLQQPVFV